ncbi:hypothetical protein B4065_0644 [Caldibacillus thermoamylovorans]|nr:hypothetical protein B4065_0644 [Caldibacillus thermoamylovorans]
MNWYFQIFSATIHLFKHYEAPRVAINNLKIIKKSGRFP